MLPRLVEHQLLSHGDREALGETAVDLPLDDHGIDAGAAVVQGIEAPDLGLTGVLVDVHHAQIGAERDK